MKIVIQCAAKKYPDAGYMQDSDGKTVIFVAAPELIQGKNNYVYQKPDEFTQDNMSWRQKLLQYNNQGSNPLNLFPAYKLYMNSTYKELVAKYGADNIFILSAGWGLINADYLTPKYDITFTSSKDKYKNRNKSDNYNDFCFLPNNCDDDLVFFGGKDYLPLFSKLTGNYHGKKFVFYNLKTVPEIEGCQLIKFETTTRTNWHYECAKAFMNGAIKI